MGHSHHRGTTFKLTALWLFIAALLTVAVVTGPTASPATAKEEELCSSMSTSVDAIEADRKTVVTVHGWTGSPLAETSQLLEAELGTSWQFLNFDYSESSNQWADEAAVAGCLVQYLNDVTAANIDAGGDGNVYLVTHSMGGLAARFALNDPMLFLRPAGLITIATPHKGTPWAGENNSYGTFKEAVSLGLKDLPDESSAASRCLGERSGGQTISECTAPPFINTRIPITTIGGNLTITRTYFGVEAYPIVFGGDSIVSLDSATGYIDSAEGDISGQRWNPTTVACSKKMSSLLSDYGSRTLPSAGLAAFGQLMADYNAAGATLNQESSPYIVELVIRANLPTGPATCSHTGLPTDPTVIAKTADALRSFAENPDGELRANPGEYVVPEYCGQRERSAPLGDSINDEGATTFLDEPFTWAPAAGVELNVVVVTCDAGGTAGWPQMLTFHDPTDRSLDAYISMGDLHDGANKGTFDTDRRKTTSNELVIPYSWSPDSGAAATYEDGEVTATWDELLEGIDFTGPGRAVTGADPAFITPSGNIVCRGLQGDVTASLYCDIAEYNFTAPPGLGNCSQPSNFNYVSRFTSGDTEWACDNERDVYLAEANVAQEWERPADGRYTDPQTGETYAVLTYGTSLIWDGMNIKCTSQPTGLTCQDFVNKTGFSISKDAFEEF